MSPEDKSTEEAQGTETAEATPKTAKQDTAEVAVKADTGTGMIAPQPDAEIPATDTSLDTPMSELAKPLFDETAPSEAELSGVEEETAAPEKEGEGEVGAEEDEKPAEEEKEKPSTEEPAGETEEKPAEAEEKAESKTPPAGYVPHAALHEERLLRQGLAQEVAGLREELATMKAEAQEDTEDTFKVLSDEEFNELGEDDPWEAVKYERRLNKHVRDQQVKKADQDAQKQQDYADQALISESVERMEKAVPGLHEEGNPVNRELTQFAVDNGMEPDYLAAMTAPGTLILPAGAKNPVLLGPGAAGLVGMIHKLHSTLKENSPETLRAEIETEVEKKLTKTITEELMKKFKTPKGGEEFKSIGEVPGASEEVPDVSGSLTEAQYANMSQAQRDKLLGA